MKRFLSFARLTLLALLLLGPAFGQGVEPEKLYYGFEMNETLVGYVEITLTPPAEPGAPSRMDTVLFAKLTLLGQDFDLRVDEQYRLDAETGRVLYQESQTETGDFKGGTRAVVEENRVTVTPFASDTSKVVELDDDVILEDSLHLDYVLRDLPEEGSGPATYRVLDYNSGEIQEQIFSRGADVTFTLEGRQHRCAQLTLKHVSTGFTGELWMELDTGRMYKATMPNGVFITRMSPAVVGKIKRAEIGDILLAPVDVAIADFQGITYMKVRAKLETVGEIVTPESLNVPGQKFTGTVTDSLVEGIFEVEHSRYDGKNAPAFPPDLGGDEELLALLEPEMLIEADDEVLIEFARELTEGSADSWEAACRLSRWVAEEIVYEIPGGSARSTFDTRKGECASHSRLLVAFCRGVGIPARLACGCMYIPNYGGTFGQHVWTEVYMGEAGWIPVDSTASEIDFVDSGHIRLGTKASFQPEKLEILDHRVSSLSSGKEAQPGSFAQLPWETGVTYVYRYAGGGKPLGTDSFTIESREKVDGRLVISCNTKFEVPGLSTEGSFQIDGDGQPISYHVAGKTAAFEYTVDCEFLGGQVVEKVVKAGQESARIVPLPDKVYLLDNNNFSGYAFLLATIPLEQGTKLTFRAFHPSSMQLLPVQIQVGAKETIEVGETEVECTLCQLNIAGTPLKLWVDEQGRIRRETESGGQLVVELD